jgi:hypothetical protein
MGEAHAAQFPYRHIANEGALRGRLGFDLHGAENPIDHVSEKFETLQLW